MNINQYRLPLNKTSRLLSLTFFVLALSSCGGNNDDLEAWVDAIKAKAPGRIEPMPDVKIYQPHDYTSSLLRSPFAVMQLELEQQLKLLHDGCDEGITPDTTRRREDLERYSLDSMEMVGSVKRPGKEWGLIRLTAGPNSGQIAPVKMGEYLGIHHGQIDKISEQQIEISTLVPDSKGCWEQRTVFLTLTDG
jgi:type IV pilus assembly protein PilP